MPPIKPGQWPVDPTMVDARWRHYWRDLVSYVPLWRQYENTSDNNEQVECLVNGLSDSNQSAQSYPVWRATEIGIAPNTASSTDEFDFRWTTGPPAIEGAIDRDGSAVTFVFYAKATISGGASPLTVWDDRGAGDYAFCIDEDGINDLRAIVNIGGTDRNAVGEWSSYASQWTMGVGRWRSGDYVEVMAWRNGRRLDLAQSASTYTGSIGSSGSDRQLQVGAGSYLDRSMAGDLGMTAIWSRWLTDAELSRLSADPFGPIRPDPLPISLLKTAAGPDVTLQYLRPDGDTDKDGWDSAPTASQPLYQQVDETVASDSDYIFDGAE